MSAPIILWYAPGGGLGHATRALAVLRHLRPRFPDAALLLVVTTPYISSAVMQGVSVLRLPSGFEWHGGGFADKAADAARALLHALGPFDLLVVDTFADGMWGELTADVLQLARRRALIFRLGGTDPDRSPAWPLYQRRFAPYPHAPRADTEALGAILIRRPDEAFSPRQARSHLGVSEDSEAPVIVALHAGDPGEVASLFWLVRLAAEQLGRPHHLRLITPLPVTDGHWPERAHLFPAAEILPGADLVIAAAGYNTHAELGCFGRRALFCPFGRSHDDQWGRLLPDQIRFELTIDPQQLATLMAQSLDRPTPAPLPADQGNGALRCAQRLESLLDDQATGVNA
ncbi:MAG: hypothetical protein H6970_10855 [Gammaproteobacteria bacterium]|nr:hypothetical protein [Gammaproteobacteria bacterium]MCP5459330.1 hypothetical protein [Gammaproteobacteria bacterium]